MISGECIAEGLSKAYLKELWKHIQEWFVLHPSITPPNVCDTFAPNDRNFEGVLRGLDDDKFESMPIVNDHANPIELSESQSYMQVPSLSPLAKSPIPPST